MLILLLQVVAGVFVGASFIITAIGFTVILQEWLERRRNGPPRDQVWVNGVLQPPSYRLGPGLPLPGEPYSNTLPVVSPPEKRMPLDKEVAKRRRRERPRLRAKIWKICQGNEITLHELWERARTFQPGFRYQGGTLIQIQKMIYEYNQLEQISDQTKRAFVFGLIDKPTDWTSYLIFADWAEDNNEPQLASTLRWMAEKHVHPIHDPKRGFWHWGNELSVMHLREKPFNTLPVELCNSILASHWMICTTWLDAVASLSAGLKGLSHE